MRLLRLPTTARRSADMLSIVSLFSGIGGLDLGVEMALHAAGIPAQTVAQCEFADYPRRVLANHWPDADLHKDVATLPALIRERRQRNRGPWRDHGADILIGGFPCQDISVAGRGAGLAGSRSGLFFDLIRVVRLLAPPVVMLENVAALPARAGADVVGAFAALGYDAAWTIVSAADVGAPHLRRRWFFVAWRPVADSDGIAVHRKYQPKASRAPVELVGDGAAGRMARRVAALGDADGARLEEHQPRRCDQHAPAQRAGGRDSRAGVARSAESRVGRTTDGLSARLGQGLMPWPAGRGEPQHDFEPARVVLDGPMPNRGARVKSLGNAVSPPQAAAAAQWGLIPALKLAGLA